MLENRHLALMNIRRVIFHDVPNNQKGKTNTLVLASAETKIDAPRRAMLKAKLTRVLDAKAAYPIVFASDTSSPVPDSVRGYTAAPQGQQSFIDMSQGLAKHLHQVQHGAISPGLLCVIEFVADGNAGLVLMKLEREAGAQLKLDSAGGKRRFAMSVLEDLVLTDGTRLFKTAAFLRQGAGKNDFLMTACDSQHRVTDSSEMARFWIKYLGCSLREEPRVSTSKFYAASIDFMNSVITDPLIRTQLYESLHAELKSNKKQIVPKTFIQEYIPDAFKDSYTEHLKEQHVPLNSFPKDTLDIRTKLARNTFYSEKGVVVSAPADDRNLVHVNAETIVVADKLKRVGRA